MAAKYWPSAKCSTCWIQVHKTYRTLVGGRLEGQGYVDIPLDGKPSLTEYRSVGQTASGNHGWISTLELLPHTGVKQLTRHLCPENCSTAWCQAKLIV